MWPIVYDLLKFFQFVYQFLDSIYIYCYFYMQMLVLSHPVTKLHKVPNFYVLFIPKKKHKYLVIIKKAKLEKLLLWQLNNGHSVVKSQNLTVVSPEPLANCLIVVRKKIKILQEKLFIRINYLLSVWTECNRYDRFGMTFHSAWTSCNCSYFK